MQAKRHCSKSMSVIDEDDFSQTITDSTTPPTGKVRSSSRGRSVNSNAQPSKRNATLLSSSLPIVRHNPSAVTSYIRQNAENFIPSRSAVTRRMPFESCHPRNSNSTSVVGIMDSLGMFAVPKFAARFAKRLRRRYDNAMSTEPDSTEYQNFTNLLRRIVTVPHAEIQKRMDDDKATKDWTRENKQKQRRQRPIVSPAAVSSSKIQP